MKIVKIGSQLGPPAKYLGKNTLVLVGTTYKSLLQISHQKKKKSYHFYIGGVTLSNKKVVQYKMPKRKNSQILGYVRIYFSISTSSHSSPQTKKKKFFTYFFFSFFSFPYYKWHFFLGVFNRLIYIWWNKIEF